MTISVVCNTRFGAQFCAHYGYDIRTITDIAPDEMDVFFGEWQPGEADKCPECGRYGVLDASTSEGDEEDGKEDDND